MLADLPAAALLVHGARPGGVPGHLHHALQIKHLQVEITTPIKSEPFQLCATLQDPNHAGRAGHAPACHCTCVTGVSVRMRMLLYAEGCLWLQRS